MMGKKVILHVFYSHLIILLYLSTSLSDFCNESPLEHTHLQRIFPEDPPREIDNHICADWCHETAIIAEVLDSQQGRVRFHVTPSPQKCNHTNYEINLLVSNIKYEECGSNTSMQLFKGHTAVNIDVIYNSTSRSDKDIKMDVDYVFTGCYQVEIKPEDSFGSHQPCRSRPFSVRTNYTINFITIPKVFHTDFPIDRMFKSSFIWNNLTTALEIVEVSLVAVGPSNEETQLTCCILDTKNSELPKHANTYGSQEKNLESCKCDWVLMGEHYMMKCAFHNLDPGLFTVIVWADDPRCQPDTIWTDLNPEITPLSPTSPLCHWSATHTFSKSNNTGTITVPPEVYHIWITYATIAVISIVLTVAAIYYCKFRKPKLIYTGYNQIMKNSFHTRLSGKTKILLLYPRDCQPFMDTMDSFRTMLKCTGKFEVFDALDPSQEEDVAVNPSTWGLNLISDPSTKVILVASWCSMRFYEALLDKDRLSYIDERAFDFLFPLHLNQLFVQKQPYKKICVVRLDCENAENLCFEKIVQSCFTLPQCTESLVNYLLELPSENHVVFEDNNEKLVAKLQDSIENYSDYVKENPNYLNSLIQDNLMIDSQTLDYNIV